MTVLCLGIRPFKVLFFKNVGAHCAFGPMVVSPLPIYLCPIYLCAIYLCLHLFVFAFICVPLWHVAGDEEQEASAEPKRRVVQQQRLQGHPVPA